jgi:O-antigen/teichoic acid export membrane protein
MYALLIGKLHGVRELAYYTRADNTKQIPVDVLSDAFARVIFPVFSAAAGDTERLRNGVRLSVQTMMLIQLPMMFGLMATAENCIYVLFGERWLSVAPILQVLCIAGMFWPLQVINLNVLKAQGHSDLFFRLEIVKKIVGIISLLIGSFYGVMGIAWCQVAYSLVKKRCSLRLI